ncbi:hypothetical protein RCO28_25610 [Streptomyces sp. LHD-70]|uniref:hypothetical protein n=1 Tax=Streptomyces sp. LHD-70 TaxID=3072140 RepID=UPI00280DB65C|nr:hypothetical protein [Streptomyces sp. LHD-70]MDQ8705847.1 hypothetical protein [Streptomyces sp. LHD-70]
MKHGDVVRAAAPLSALLLLTACGTGERICTLRGSLSGIRVVVAPKLADKVADAGLTACWDGSCREGGLRLREEENHGSSSEPASPWPGFAVVPDLPKDGKTAVRVTVVLKDASGATVVDEQIAVVPKPTYPNGRRCAPGSPQGRVHIGVDGTLSTR